MTCGASAIVSSLARRRGDRPLADDGEAIAVEPDDGAMRVGQKDHVAYPEIEENLRADAVVAQLGYRIVALLDEAAHAVEQRGRQGLAQQHDDAAADLGDH